MNILIGMSSDNITEHKLTEDNLKMHQLNILQDDKINYMLNTKLRIKPIVTELTIMQDF